MRCALPAAALLPPIFPRHAGGGGWQHAHSRSRICAPPFGDEAGAAPRGPLKLSRMKRHPAPWERARAPGICPTASALIGTAFACPLPRASAPTRPTWVRLNQNQNQEDVEGEGEEEE